MERKNKMGRPPTDTEPTQIRIPRELKREAEQLAEKDGRKLSNWIIKLVRDAVAKK